MLIDTSKKNHSVDKHKFTFNTQIPCFNSSLRKRAYNNIMGKRELCENHSFLVVSCSFPLINRFGHRMGPTLTFIILDNVVCLFLQTFLSLVTFECNTTSDWLNHTVNPIRSRVTFKSTKSCRKRQRMFLGMVGEYRPGSVESKHRNF